MGLLPTIAGRLLGQPTGGCLVPGSALVAEGQAAKIDGWTVMAVPGEVVAGTSDALRAREWFVACANDYFGVFSEAGEGADPLELFGPVAWTAFQPALRDITRRADEAGDVWLRIPHMRFGEAVEAAPDVYVITGVWSFDLGFEHGHALRGRIRSLLAGAEKALVAKVLEDGGRQPARQPRSFSGKPC